MKTNVNKFAISNCTALKLATHSLRSYFKVTCEYELHTLPNSKVSTAKDHGENYIKVRPPLVRHLLRKVCSINSEPPDNDLCSACHVYPFSREAGIISVLFILNRFTWGLNYII